MQTLALHFDFSHHPLPDGVEMSRLRQDLSVNLEKALRASGRGRWRGGRYARGIVTIFLEVPDATRALEKVRQVLADTELTDRMAVGMKLPEPTA